MEGAERCPWTGIADPLYARYHDEEWGVPKTDDRAMFEKLVLEGFQAGLSWLTILRKRENFRKAFHGFDAERIARYSTRDIARLMADPGIVRNKLKVEATIDNARALLKLQERTGLAAFLWGFVDGRPQINTHRSFKNVLAETPTSKAISKALKAEGFRFVGPTTVYAFMQATGMVNDHLMSCHRYEPCAKLQRSFKAPAARSAHMTDNSARSTPKPAELRAWQRMLSGRRLDLLDPSPADIEIADIAHGLARVARWNGQTIGDHAFSVAQHALVVEQIAAALEPAAEPRWLLAALLHDAPEYVIGDLISPFKAAVGLDYKAFEVRLLQAIHRRFGLPPVLPEAVAAGIKHADRVAAYYEATVLAGFSLEEAGLFFGEPSTPSRGPAAGLESSERTVGRRRPGRIHGAFRRSCGKVTGRRHFGTLLL